MPNEKEKPHIAPDRIHRFMDDDESIQHQEVIPGPHSLQRLAAPPAPTKPRSKTK